MSSFTDRLMGKLFSRPKSGRSQRPKSAATSTCHVKSDPRGDGDWGVDKTTIGSGAAVIHTDAVASVSPVLPSLCLSGTKDGVVRLFDLNSKSLIDTWSGHTSAITKVCYGAARSSVFSASRDKSIKLWHQGRKQCVREFLGHSLVVSALHVNADCTSICSGSRDNTVRLWDVESAVCTRTNTIPQNLVTDVKFVPGTSLIVQTGEDKEVRVFDLRSLEPVFSFPKKQYIQMCCDVTQDGRYVCSSSNGFSGNGCEATIWDLRERKLLHEFRGHHEAVESCVFLSDSHQHPLAVVSASRDCTVRLWDGNSGACLSMLSLSGAGPLTSLATYGDGIVVVGSFNQGAHVLKTNSDSLTPLFNY